MKKKNLSTLKLTIIIPVYNEEATIKILLDAIEKQNYVQKQIIIIDDNSNDNSLEIINKYNFFSDYKILKNSKNEGKGSCIIKAKEYVNGDIVLIQDADLEYDPSDYKILINAFLNNKERVVYGSRILNYKKKYFISNGRILANKFLTFFSNIINKQNLTDAHTCYKMLDANLFKRIELQERGFAFCPEINTKIGNMNEKIIEIAINYKGRTYNEGKKIKFYHGLQALLAILKYKAFFNN